MPSKGATTQTALYPNKSPHNLEREAMKKKLPHPLAIAEILSESAWVKWANKQQKINPESPGYSSK